MEVCNPFEYPGWDELVARHEAASVFHTSNWARTLAETYRYEPAYFASISNGELQDLIPVMKVSSLLTGRRGVSLPFTDYCEPILSDRGRIAEVLDILIRYGRESHWRHIELRPEQALSEEFTPSLTYVGHSLDLSRSEDEIFSSVHSGTRRNVRKAIRAGVRVSALTSLDATKRFYRLNCVTRKQHGLPPQPFRFFESLHHHVLSKDLGFVALASHEGKDLAGAVFFRLKDKALYKYSASETRFHDLRANHLVMWEGIKKCRERGARRLSFGRTEKENEGLIQYKSGWGTDSYTIPYYKYDLEKRSFVTETSRVTGLHNWLFRSMPIPLSRVLGSLLYRHIG